MKCWVYCFLILFVAMVASAKTNADLTNNLLNDDWDNGGWTGSNIDHRHQDLYAPYESIIAGEHGGTINKTITVSDHLISNEYNQTWTSKLTGEVWFWNNYSQHLSVSQEITASNGDVLSNNTIMNGSCPSCGYQDVPVNTIIVPENTHDDFTIDVEFGFDVSSRPNGHYGADFRSPSLTIEYTPFEVDLSTTNEIEDWLSDFEEQFREEFTEPEFIMSDDIYEEPAFFFDDYFSTDEPTFFYEPETEDLMQFLMADETPSMYFSDDEDMFFATEEMEMEMPMMMDDAPEEMTMEFMMQEEFTELMPEESTDIYEEPEEMAEEMIEEEEEQMEEEMAEEEMSEAMPEESQDMPESEQLTKEEFAEESIEEESSGEIEKEATVENDETEKVQRDGVKGIKIKKTALAQAIEIDQLKITVMIDSQPLMVDASFYAPINIYPQQITMVDNRQIYDNIVLSYVVNDPLNTHTNLIDGNREQQYEIRTKLKSMRWIN